ncbi:hypothetical protein ACE1TH_18735 [Shouchella sp. JSM 1781072]|uniref:hypothetical protein n=1 Tax=Shouchella sp. JSM 1781072 TaxID=3344581 RepID=UPI0035BED898
MILLYIASEFVDHTSIQSAMGVLALIIISINFFKVKRLYFWAGTAFFSVGLVCAFLYVPAERPFLSLFGSMTSLLALLFVLPYMSTIIAVGKYDRALGQMIRKPPQLTMVRLYRRTSMMTYMLTLFLNVATVPVVVSTVKAQVSQLKNAFIQRFFAHSILRAYGLVLLWSPTEVLVASTIDMTGTNYLLLFPTLFTISVLFISLDWFIHNRQLKHVDLKAAVEVAHNPVQLRKKLLELGFAITCFIVLLLSLNAFIPQSFLFSVTVLIIPFTFMWAFFIKKGKRFSILSTAYVKGNTTQLHGLFFLFLAAGFFVEVFPYTTLFGHMDTFFSYVYESGPILLFYLLIAVCIFSFALIGFHPLISIAIFSPFLADAMIAHPYGVSVLLIGVGLSTVMIGPFNITPTILAMQLQANPYAIIQKNLVFAFSYLLFIVGVATVFSLIL